MKTSTLNPELPRQKVLMVGNWRIEQFQGSVERCEFEKRLSRKGFGGRGGGFETTDKMTNPQIEVKVRQFYQ